MAQERIQPENKKAATTPTQAPSISNTVSSAGKVLDKVRVVYGANEGYFEIGGKTVGQAKKSLRDAFNIPSDAEANIAGEFVGDDAILLPGQVLEFSKETGVKGAKKATNPQIRWLIRRDMPSVLEIERGSFEVPWTEEDFMCCLRQRNCIGMVVEQDHEIVGFMIYELHKKHLGLLNFAVHPSWRRKKVGAVMVNRLIDKLSQQRRNSLLLEIRETNLDGQLFFQAMGFRALQVKRNHYPEPVEDAYVMGYCLTPEQMFQEYNPRNRISEYLVTETEDDGRIGEIG